MWVQTRKYNGICDMMYYKQQIGANLSCDLVIYRKSGPDPATLIFLETRECSITYS